MHASNLLAETPPLPRSKRGEPAWEIALLYPRQGEWTEAEYLALDTNRLIELSDGCLDVLATATIFHQRIVEFLYIALKGFVDARSLGKVLFAPLRLRLWSGKIREPDLLLFRPEHVSDPHEPLNGADLVVEVVTGGSEDRRRDLEIKRGEYARAGIAEYWIVDPQEQSITVLALDGGSYREHGVFGPGQRASSVLLAGFDVGVQEVFAAGLQPPQA